MVPQKSTGLESPVNHARQNLNISYQFVYTKDNVHLLEVTNKFIKSHKYFKIHITTCMFSLFLYFPQQHQGSWNHAVLLHTSLSPTIT